METTITASVSAKGQCIMCNLPLTDLSVHRKCLLLGLEQGTVTSMADWLKKCKPKPRRVIRRVLKE